VVLSDGSLVGHGAEWVGQLGWRGAGIIDIGGLKAVAVACSFLHTVVLIEDGSIRAFGENSKGQLGRGDTDNRGDVPAEQGANLPPVPHTLCWQTRSLWGSPDLYWTRVLDGFAQKVRLSTLE